MLKLREDGYWSELEELHQDPSQFFRKMTPLDLVNLLTHEGEYLPAPRLSLHLYAPSRLVRRIRFTATVPQTDQARAHRRTNNFT